MAEHLVIVESSSKSKTIQKYLAQSKVAQQIGKFKVVASLGHIVDLPVKELGVNTEEWKLSYEPIAKKDKLIRDLRKMAKDAKKVYLASDPDREGEAIAWHLQNTLKIKDGVRITFHEITPKAIENALLQPRKLDIPLIDAQESRRALDRIVGYKVSPLLWHRFATGSLSAGRVQSVALAEIVKRFQDYQKHTPEPFWNIEGIFELYKTTLESKVYHKKEQTIRAFQDKSQVQTMLKELKHDVEWGFQFEKKIAKTNPAAPYTTSALQQEAYERYGIPAKQTMSYAQNLYEKGYITYMRTDSANLSAQAKEEIHNYLREAFNEEAVYDRSFKNKVANAQEAHECIRPSNFDMTRETIQEEEFKPGHLKIYDLIWRKAVASQMPPAEYTQYHFKLTNPRAIYKDYEFRGKVSFLNTLGYLEIWQPQQKLQHTEIEKWDKLLQKKSFPIKFVKAFANGDVSRAVHLYNEPNIIQWMEKEGIGRPSTYSTILDKLFTKGYITKGSSPPTVMQVENYVFEKEELSQSEETLQIGGKDKDKFIPSSLGERVVEYIHHVLPDILNKTFTAEMEENLDKISRNEISKQSVLSTFYKSFEVQIKEAQKEQKAHQGEKKPTTERKPTNVLKEFHEANLIQTRFGPALYIEETKRFVSVAPLLQWKEKEIDDLTQKDVSFLISMPKQYTDITVEMGRYGLYLVHNKQNYRLPKEVWEKVWNDTVQYNELKNYLVAPPPKKKFLKKAST